MDNEERCRPLVTLFKELDHLLFIVNATRTVSIQSAVSRISFLFHVSQWVESLSSDISKLNDHCAVEYDLPCLHTYDVHLVLVVNFFEHGVYDWEGIKVRLTADIGLTVYKG